MPNFELAPTGPTNENERFDGDVVELQRYLDTAALKKIEVDPSLAERFYIPANVMSRVVAKKAENENPLEALVRAVRKGRLY